MSVAKCANPECGAEFRRLGTGKLFVKTLTKATGSSGNAQRTAWLCAKCTEHGFDLRFDRKSAKFQLVERKKAA